MKRVFEIAVPVGLLLLGLGSAHALPTFGKAVPIAMKPIAVAVKPIPVVTKPVPIVVRPTPVPVKPFPHPIPVKPTPPPTPAPPPLGTAGSTLYKNGKAYVVQANQGPVTPRAVAPDAMRRLSSLRKLAPTAATGRAAVIVQSGYSPVSFNMTAPSNLGRAPTSADITVNAGLDGKTPQQALAIVQKNAQMPIYQGNQSFVAKTVLDTHKAFTIAVNNAFTSGSPSNTFIKNNFAGAQISILGTMSDDTPVVIMAKRPNDAVSKFYARSATGAYAEMPSMPYPVIMKAKLQNGVSGGVRVNYTRWGSSGLSGPTATFEEMGASVPDINHGNSFDP